MNAPLAIVFSIGLFLVSIFLNGVTGFNVTLVMVLGTAVWAAVDSSKLQLKRYKSGIAYGPGVLFVCCLLLWIVAFPWYLAVRNRIQNGTAILKEPPQVV